MTVYLQKLRLTHTTANQRYADTDSGVYLDLFIDPSDSSTYPYSGWKSFLLDSSRDDRERGVEETYEIDFTLETTGVSESIGGTIVPNGIRFSNLTDVNTLVAFLRIRGADWWLVKDYKLEGQFKEVAYFPGPIVDHEWLTLSLNSYPINLSTDKSEGVSTHHIIIKIAS